VSSLNVIVVMLKCLSKTLRSDAATSGTQTKLKTYQYRNSDSFGLDVDVGRKTNCQFEIA
jgi:hypothetical protein